MARPTKDEIEKREKIKELNLFVRDSEIYSNFEYYTIDDENPSKNKSKSIISYLFCMECDHRYHAEYGVMGVTNITKEKTVKFIDGLKEYIPLEKKDQVNKLSELSYSNYARILHLFFKKDLPKEINYSFDVLNIINHNDLVQALGTTRADKYYSRYEEIPTSIIDQNNLKHEDIDNLKQANLNFLSIIKRYTIFPDIYDYVEKNRITYVELDFTKPKEELLEFISHIKDNFDDDPQTIQNLNDLLGDKTEFYKCDLETCDIYKSNNKKPIGGRLADVLFIYDCRKAGLNKEYIIKEINRYWQEIRHLFPENTNNFQPETTYMEYKNLGIDYIDNQKYKCYLSGYHTAK